MGCVHSVRTGPIRTLRVSVNLVQCGRSYCQKRYLSSSRDNTMGSESDFRALLQSAVNDPQRYPSLQSAFEHPSVVNSSAQSRLSFQRLEFLGDSVLGLVATELLMGTYTQANEGELTVRRARLVNETALADWGKRVGVEDIVQQRTRVVNNRVIADTVEAMLGAIYLDQGFPQARDIVRDIISRKIDERKLDVELANPKGKLMEYATKRKSKVEYQTVDRYGEDHCPQFVISVSMDGEVLAVATATSKKKAEQSAAESALAILRQREGFSNESILVASATTLPGDTVPSDLNPESDQRTDSSTKRSRASGPPAMTNGRAADSPPVLSDNTSSNIKKQKVSLVMRRKIEANTFGGDDGGTQ